MPEVPKKRRPGRRFHWITFVLGLAVTAGFLLFFAAYPRLLVSLELKVSDARLRARSHRPFSNKVVIVAIDNKSLEQIGRWPWDRWTLANLEQAFIDYKVKVVGYDVLFDERDPVDVERDALTVKLKTLHVTNQDIHGILGPRNDQMFADAIRAHGRTILAYNFSDHMVGAAPPTTQADYLTKVIDPKPMSWNVRTDPGAAPELISAGGYRPPLQILNSAAKKAGFVDADSDDDGLFRREMTAISFDGRQWASLFITAVWAYQDQPPRELMIGAAGITQAVLGDTIIPVDEVGRMLVTYQGPAGTIPHYSAADVINHLVNDHDLAGKIVLVGVTGTGLGDRAVTPVGNEFPRVEIHANAIETILSRDFVHDSKTETLVMERVWAVLLGIGVSIATAWLSAAWSVAAMLVLAGSYFGFAQFMLLKRGVMLGMVLPFVITGGAVVILLGYRYITEGREKGHLRHIFEHYLHPDVIASVVDNPEGLRLGGERRHVAILFADIVGFTSLAERSDPVQLVAMLHVYMTRMTNIILESGGVVDKLMGDGIMAFWGAPYEVENPARRAIDAALQMVAALESLRKEDPRFLHLEVGIGIATGDPIAGNFGGERRFDYSVIGDSVNFASRLEGLTRKFGVRFLVSKDAFTEASAPYIARDIGLVKVKGKASLVAIMEVVGRRDDGVDPTFYDQFERTVELLKDGDADQARAQLEEMLAARPTDEVVSLYLAKLNESHDEPPREMVFEFETK
jgi:adenylate cyclase